MESNDVLKLMTSHRSIRAFTNKRVTKEQIETIVSSAQWASTSHHVQAYSVIAVEDPARKETLADLTGGQRWVNECRVFFVICADFSRHASASKQHQVSFDVGGAEQLLVSAVDAALFAQNLMLAAESLGLGGVMIGGIRNQPKEVSDLLHLPTYVFPVMGMAIGEPDSEPGQKPRLPLKAVLHQETYQSDQEDALSAYDETMSAYYAKRTNGKRTTGWTASMAAYTKERKRPHLDAFLKEKGFLQED
ncbi:oxygen-insensitive NADPH nitroreductase [Shouchella tritolerans]|uniref:oxygen-insensitive NADPH nitroreductase n=1 Tax=Shouchella tritolerans TaxID=2979466 RepID=UPI0021E89F67|nr:oxygen-insensitive NADPH nitroreductase [Shouchella tritolerans]